MSKETLARPVVDPESDPRIRTQLETGQISFFEADIETTGVRPSAESPSFTDAPVSRAVKAEKSRRRPALPGLEAGAISGRDQSRIIANREASNNGPTILSEEGIAARQAARDTAHRVAYTNFLKTILDLPQNEQMARIRVWEERHSKK